MSIELPFFKFRPDEWLTGDITLLGWDLQGIFIHICAYYWKRNCSVLLTKLKQRYSIVTDDQWDQLFKIIKHDENTDEISISFLDEQLSERGQLSDKKSSIGKLGATKKWDNVRKIRQAFEEMKIFFDNTCVRCEGKSGMNDLHLDHIIPKYKGGIDNPTNWQPLCRTCNTSKGPEEIDWRIIYADKHGKIMPKAWMCHKNNLAEHGYKEKDKDKDKEEDKEYSSEILELYNSIVVFFEEKTRPHTPAQIAAWHDTLEKCIRIDGYTAEQIREIVKRMRMDDFWRSNFMSIMKLRQLNKEKVKYIDVFAAKLNSKPKSTFGIPKVERDYSTPQTSF